MNRVVLVVDDEQELRMLLTVQLRREGYDVYSAESGEKALELLRSGVHVDALVSDIRMPGGMDGIELIKAIRSEKIVLPVNILMSGHAILHPEEIKKLGIDVCFSKPFPAKKLAGALEEMLANVDGKKSPRQYPRMQTRIDVEEEEFSSQTMDVSLGGVFIRMDQPIAVGTRFSVQLDLEPPFVAELEVKWVRPLSTEVKPSGIGCEFVGVSEADILRLREHLTGLGQSASSLVALSKEMAED